MAQRRQPDSHAMHHKPPAQHIPPAPISPPPSGGLPNIGHILHELDGERLALLGLLYVLYKEGADARLLLAIAYILL